jgi:adenylate cyclase
VIDQPTYDETLIPRLPLPLARLYRRACNARSPFDVHQAAYFLWEASLRLLAAVAVVAHAEGAARDDVFRPPARPLLSDWWAMVRRLVPALAEAGDPGFRAVRELVLGRSRADLPRTAALVSALDEAIGKPSNPRPQVKVSELYDRLVQYRNRELGHGAAGRRPGEFYARMGGAVLAGVSELLTQLDVLAGRRLVYIEEVRLQRSGLYLIEGYELMGEVPRRLRPVACPRSLAARLPWPEQVHLQAKRMSPTTTAEPPDADRSEAAIAGDGASFSCLSPHVVYDPGAEEVLFLNARRDRGRCEYLCYTTGAHQERHDPDADADVEPGVAAEAGVTIPAGAEPRTEAERVGVAEPQPREDATRREAEDDRRGVGTAPGQAPAPTRRRHVPLGPTSRGALIGVVCGLACWLLSLHPVLQGLEEWCQDAWFVYRGRRASTTKVVLVAIDDGTLDRLPKPLALLSPELAEVVSHLRRRGARAIGLDVMVPETLEAYPGLRGADLGLAAAEADNVVLPAILRDDGRLLRPLLTWQTGAALALVNLDEDRDHFVRRLALAGRVDGRNYDQFALALLYAAGRAQADTDGRLRIDGRLVPLDDEGRLPINYVGPPGTIPAVSFGAVLDVARGQGGAAPLQDVRDALVIVGVTARSQGDYHATPYANANWRAFWAPGPGLMAGPEIHANLVATLGDGAYIVTPWWLTALPPVLTLGAVLGAVFARLGLLRGFLVAVAHHFGWRVVSFVAFCAGPWRVEMVAMLLTGAVCYGATFTFRWLWLRRLFGAVKSQAIARALEDDPGRLRRAGEERTITVLFADIRDFTAFSDGHSAREVVALLNAYYDVVVPIVEQYGGTVDKYIGDGLMALFGVPHDLPDHAARAVRAAVAMVTAIHAQPGRWAALDYPGLRIGIGIHTGPAVIGALGSWDRLDYTAIGEAVDVAAWLTAAGREHDAEILISARTYRGVPADERARLGCAERPEAASVRGRREVLAIHRVVVPAGADATPRGPGTERPVV